MNFHCSRKLHNKLEKWQGTITHLKNYGSHYEMVIQSRSGLFVLFGQTSRGGFVCLPDFDAGCDLACYDDLFWNRERLAKLLGDVDALTVATALKKLKQENLIS